MRPSEGRARPIKALHRKFPTLRFAISREPDRQGKYEDHFLLYGEFELF